MSDTLDLCALQKLRLSQLRVQQLRKPNIGNGWSSASNNCKVATDR